MLTGAPCTFTAQGYSTSRFVSSARSPPQWTLSDTVPTLQPTFPAGRAGEALSNKRGLGFSLKDITVPDCVPIKTIEGFPTSFSWEVFPDKDITAVCSQPGITAVIDFYWVFFFSCVHKGKKGFKKINLSHWPDISLSLNCTTSTSLQLGWLGNGS